MIWLLMGASCLLIATMLLVSGIVLVSAESTQRITALVMGVLLGAMGLTIMVYLAAPGASTSAYNGVLWGSVVCGAVAAALLGWKRMAG